MNYRPSRSSAAHPNGNGRTFLERAANLSTVLTLVALIGIGATAQAKLDAIDRRGQENCRSVNAGIVLTLESGRANAKDRSQERALDRTIARFQRLERQC